MLRVFRNRGSTLAVALLMAVAPLWCCCAMTAAEAAEHDRQSATSACGNCEDREAPDAPAGDTQPSDEPDENCDCEHETVVLNRPGPSGQAAVASLAWDQLAERLGDHAGDGFLIGGGHDGAGGVSDSFADATMTGPLPGTVSLVSLHCLMTT